MREWLKTIRYPMWLMVKDKKSGAEQYYVLLVGGLKLRVPRVWMSSRKEMPW